MGKRGLLITFEGGEGTGKSTQIALLRDFLEKEGKREIIVTREPGGVEIAEKIRQILLDEHYLNKITPKTELFLYLAARAQHFAEIIEPALLAGKIVLCDRFIDATLAYQGFARDLGMEQLYEFNKWISPNILPDLTFLFLLDVEKGLERESIHDRFFFEGLSFHKKVYVGYEKVAEMFPNRVKKIYINNRSIEEVFSVVKKRFLEVYDGL